MNAQTHLRICIPILASIAASISADAFAADTYPIRPIVVPARTPRAIIDLLNAEVTKILNLPDVRTTLFDQGLDPAPGTPEQFGAYIRSEGARRARVIRQSGAKAE